MSQIDTESQIGTGSQAGAGSRVAQAHGAAQGGDSGGGPDQVVRRGARAARHRPVGAARDGARRARPERRGQDDRGPDPDHAAAARTAGGPWSRGTTWCGDAAAVRRSIGLSGQSAAIQEELTGRENLEIIGRLYHLSWPEARSRAAELLEQFDLTDAADRAAKTYSGGMQRRLDLAASLVGRPQVLFLDEPTTGLDPRSRLGMWDIIRSLVAGGTTLLLTTQYLDEADELADEIVVIDHGLVIAAGTSEELKGRVGGDVLEFTVPDRAGSPTRSRRSPSSARASRTWTRRPA